MRHLTHENLDVYNCSIDFLALSFRLLAHLPRGEREIRGGCSSHFARESASGPPNLPRSAWWVCADSPVYRSDGAAHGLAAPPEAPIS